MGLFGCSNLGMGSDAKLVSFCYSSGGGMDGGGSSTEVYTIEDRVYLKISDTEWWYEDNNVKEYQVSNEILEEITKVFKKYKFNRWNNKKFTNMFISDGASHSYRFEFDNNKSVYFSSQIYPSKYRKKLDEIHEIIKKYTDGAKAEPGLIKPEKTHEEKIYHAKPDNGSIELEVYEYSRKELYYRILNGTSEEVTVTNDIKLISAGTEEVIYESKSKYDNEVGANYASEECVSLKGRLPAGKYTLHVGEYSVDFEIGIQE